VLDNNTTIVGCSVRVVLNTVYSLALICVCVLIEQVKITGNNYSNMNTVVLTETNEHTDRYCNCSYCSAKSGYLTENTVFLNR